MKRIYVLTEWDGRGSGERVLITNDRKEAMRSRKHILTRNQAIKKYGREYFYNLDISCSTIDSYTSKRAMREGLSVTTKTWY